MNKDPEGYGKDYETILSYRHNVIFIKGSLSLDRYDIWLVILAL